jgi:hypothetical protein
MATCEGSIRLPVSTTLPFGSFRSRTNEKAASIARFAIIIDQGVNLGDQVARRTPQDQRRLGERHA